MAKLPDLEMGVDARGVKRGLGEARREFNKTQREIRKNTQKMRKSMERVEKATRGIRNAIIALGSVATLRAMVRMGGAIAKTEENAGRLSIRLGIAVEQLTALQHAAEQSGLTVQTFNMGLQRMVRRISEAGIGIGEARGALEELGLGFKELALLPVEEQLAAIADAMKAVERGTNRVRLAQKIFDSEGVAFVQILAEGSAGMARLTEEARTLGLVVSQDAADAAIKFSDEMSRFTGAIAGAARKIVDSFLPALGDMLRVFNNISDARKGALGAFTNDELTKALERQAELIERGGFGLLKNLRLQKEITAEIVKRSVLEFGDLDLKVEQAKRAAEERAERAETETRLASKAAGGVAGSDLARLFEIAIIAELQDAETAEELNKLDEIIEIQERELRLFESLVHIASNPQVPRPRGDQGPLGFGPAAVPQEGGGEGEAGFIETLTGTIKRLISAAFSMASIISAMIGALIAFVVTSETFKDFAEKIQIIIKLLQKVLEPLKPVLDQIALLFLGVSKLLLFIFKPILDALIRVFLPVFVAAVKILDAILSIFGLSINQDDLEILEDLEEGSTVTLRLDASEAIQELDRAQDALLAAGDDVTREAARQRFLSAREAAILAQQAAEGDQPAPEDIFGAEVDSAILDALEAIADFFERIVENLSFIVDKLTEFFDFLEGVFNDIAEIPEDFLNALSAAPGAFWNGLTAGAGQIISDFWEGMTAPLADFWTDFLDSMPSAEEFKAALTSMFDVSISPPGGGKGTIENALSIDFPWMSFSHGGIVPGPRGAGDVVPSLLTPGEGVLTVGQMDQLSLPDPSDFIPDPSDFIPDLPDIGDLPTIDDFIDVAGEVFENIADLLKKIQDALLWDWLRNHFGGLLKGVMDSTKFFGLADAIGFADGTNLTRGGSAMIHGNEAILPSAFNPSSPDFDPVAFWKPALDAFPGGGGTTIIVVDSDGNPAEIDEARREDVLQIITNLERQGNIQTGTVVR